MKLASKGRKKSKLPKPRLWGDTHSTEAINQIIRERDKECQFPNCHKINDLTVSHYIGRKTNATRYDPDNLCLLCRNHHYWNKTLGWEFQKQRKGEHGWDGQYTLYMKRTLGPQRFNDLLARSKTHLSRSSAIMRLMILLGAL